MHNKFRQCLNDCKALDAPGLLNRTDLDTSITADKILYSHAIQMVGLVYPLLSHIFYFKQPFSCFSPRMAAWYTFFIINNT